MGKERERVGERETGQTETHEGGTAASVVVWCVVDVC